MVLPHWHDWFRYVGVAALGSATLIVGAIGLIAEKSFAPYAIAGARILLLFASIWCSGPHVVDDQEPEQYGARRRFGSSSLRTCGAGWAGVCVAISYPQAQLMGNSQS